MGIFYFGHESDSRGISPLKSDGRERVAVERDASEGAHRMWVMCSRSWWRLVKSRH